LACKVLTIGVGWLADVVCIACCALKAYLDESLQRLEGPDDDAMNTTMDQRELTVKYGPRFGAALANMPTLVRRLSHVQL